MGFLQHILDLKFNHHEIGSTPNIGSYKYLQNGKVSVDFQNVKVLRLSSIKGTINCGSSPTFLGKLQIQDHFHP